ncbi:MAG: FkbM family methyltransferase [Chloroflexota bacterium]
MHAKLRVGNSPEVAIVLDADAKELVTEALRAGQHPSQLIVELLLRLIRPGQRVLDVGAHVGSVGLFAAAGAHVIAVEGSRTNAALIEQSTKVNSFSTMRVIHAAVADRDGEVSFTVHGPWGHISVAGEDEAAWNIERVPAFTIDSIVRDAGWPAVDLLKIDVEGGEHAAFLGANELLSSTNAPIVIFESNEWTSAMAGHTSVELR